MHVEPSTTGCQYAFLEDNQQQQQSPTLSRSSQRPPHPTTRKLKGLQPTPGPGFVFNNLQFLNLGHMKKP